MDTQEFKSEFNLAYNNISSNQAPGLDGYEIGVYLTKAQDIVTDSIYAEFEKSEAARRKLANLVTTKKLNACSVNDDNKLYSNDNLVHINTYEAPTDLRYIVNEQLKMKDNAPECIKGKFIKVQPILLDEYDTIIENPYRFNIHRALRLDAASNNTPYIEIVTKQTSNINYIDYYKIRYIKNPDPIIIEDLTGTLDSINGQQSISLGSLPKETHRQIVEIAAKMAYANYKQ